MWAGAGRAAVFRGCWGGGRSAAVMRKAAVVRWLVVLWGLASVFLVPSQVFAQGCTPSVASVSFNTYTTPAKELSMSPGMGNFITELVPMQFGVSEVFSCPSSVIARSEAVPTLARIPGTTVKMGAESYGVYFTGIPGIGLMMSFYDDAWASSPKTLKDIVPGGTSFSPREGFPAAKNTKIAVKIIPFLIGNLETGDYNIPRQQVGEVRIRDAAGGLLAAPVPILISGWNIKVTTKGCKLVERTQSVPLSPVSVGEFKEVGKPTGAKGSFSITLVDCSASTTINATMTDASNPGNKGDVLGLAGDSTATGIGLNLFKNNDAQPLKYGHDPVTANLYNLNNPNKPAAEVTWWPIGKTLDTESGKSFPITFTVKYIKTAAVVTPGSVHAESTITFSYQ